MQTEFLQKVSDALAAASPLAALASPVAGGALVLASHAVDAFNKIDDDKLQNGVIGLPALAAAIEKMAESGVLNHDELMQIAEELRSINDFISKFAKMIG